MNNIITVKKKQRYYEQPYKSWCLKKVIFKKTQKYIHWLKLKIEQLWNCEKQLFYEQPCNLCLNNIIIFNYI